MKFLTKMLSVTLRDKISEKYEAQATELLCSVVMIPPSFSQVTISIVSPEACHPNYPL